MAKDTKDAAPTQPDTVTVKASDLKALMDRIDRLEHEQRITDERLDRKAKVILDQKFEDWKKKVSRSAGERTQEIADEKWGKDGPRFRCKLEWVSKTENEKPRSIAEHPEIELSANSEHEASGRYLELCGITKHDHKLVVTRVGATEAKTMPMQPHT